MTVVYGGDNLSEDSPSVFLVQLALSVEVVVELPALGVVHHQHDLVLLLKHCGAQGTRYSLSCLAFC